MEDVGEKGAVAPRISLATLSSGSVGSDEAEAPMLWTSAEEESEHETPGRERQVGFRYFEIDMDSVSSSCIFVYCLHYSLLTAAFGLRVGHTILVRALCM